MQLEFIPPWTIEFGQREVNLVCLCFNEGTLLFSIYSHLARRHGVWQRVKFLCGCCQNSSVSA